MPPSPDGSQIIHASCVAIEGRAVVILGPSGAGKSALALQLMALGAQLVADDRTVLHPDGPVIWASSPDSIRGMVEARGVGILTAQPCPRARVHLVVDLARSETERLPPRRHYGLFDQQRPLLYRVAAAHFPAAILQYLKAGRKA